MTDFMPEKVEQYDLVVLGGGKGGKSLALALAPMGYKVCLIEAKMLGGSCINVACIPTKTMVAGTRLVYEAGQARARGFKLSLEGNNIQAVIARKRQVVSSMVETHEKLFTTTENLTFLKGLGSFVASSEGTVIKVELEGSCRYVTGKTIVVNTGTKPLMPIIEGMEQVPVLTSTSIMELNYLPGHLAIIGGGYIALEFAQIFARLGSRVTLLERGTTFLPREDRDIADCVQKILQEEGVEILFDVKVEKLSLDGQDKVLHLNTGGTVREFRATDILAATGRASVNEALNLAAVGIDVDSRGFIKVNEYLETSRAGVFAVGDCKGGPFFTHASWDDFRILKDNIVHSAGRTTTGRLIPYTLFVEPELGRVGLTEAEALKSGRNIQVLTLPAAKIPRANTEGETRGMLKAIIDRDSKEILGFAALSLYGGEIASAVQVAMLAGMPCNRLGRIVFSHPTMCESLNLLFQGV